VQWYWYGERKDYFVMFKSVSTSLILLCVLAISYSVAERR